MAKLPPNQDFRKDFIRLTYDELLVFKSSEDVSDFHCVTGYGVNST